MNAGKLISELTTILSTDIKGIDALNLMQGEKTKHLPICDNKKYVAIISENDISATYVSVWNKISLMR